MQINFFSLVKKTFFAKKIDISDFFPLYLCIALDRNYIFCQYIYLKSSANLVIFIFFLYFLLIRQNFKKLTSKILRCQFPKIKKILNLENFKFNKN